MTEILLCTNCMYQGSPKTIVKGSFLIEVVLWFFLIIPGLIYTIWRSGAREKVCPQCGALNMIPLDSPRAQQLIAK